MSIMLGDGAVTQASSQTIDRTAVVRATTTSLPEFFLADVYDSALGSARKKIYMGSSTTPAGMIDFDDSGITLVGVFDETGTELKYNSSSITDATSWAGATATAGTKYFVKYQITATTKTITVSGDSFPGTYYVQGDTYARSDVDGKDQFFQFIIPKAKMSSENTITLEAEGDPSVFNMNLTVLRPEDGDMMKLVQYDIEA